MNIPLRAFFVFLGALPLAASTLDVSRDSFVTLAQGDSLVFRISVPALADGNALPLRTSFSLYTTSGNSSLFSTWNLQALLRPIDSSYSEDFGDLNYTSGAMMRNVTTPGAIVSGSMELEAEDGGAIFGGGRAILELVNLGDSITLGRGGATLADILTLGYRSYSYVNGIQVSSGRAGVVAAVGLQKATFVEAAPMVGQPDGEEPPSDTPEPAALLTVCAGLAALAALRRPWRRNR